MSPQQFSLEPSPCPDVGGEGGKEPVSIPKTAFDQRGKLQHRSICTGRRQLTACLFVVASFSRNHYCQVASYSKERSHSVLIVRIYSHSTSRRNRLQTCTVTSTSCTKIFSKLCEMQIVSVRLSVSNWHIIHPNSIRNCGFHGDMCHGGRLGSRIR